MEPMALLVAAILVVMAVAAQCLVRLATQNRQANGSGHRSGKRNKRKRNR